MVTNPEGGWDEGVVRSECADGPRSLPPGDGQAGLEPEWEAKFEGNSYGFRPGRGCHDALEKIHLLACPHRRKKWVVDADIKGAFDSAT